MYFPCIPMQLRENLGQNGNTWCFNVDSIFFFQANLDRKLVVWTFILITDYHAGRKNIFGEKIEVNETNKLEHHTRYWDTYLNSFAVFPVTSNIQIYLKNPNQYHSWISYTKLLDFSYTNQIFKARQSAATVLQRLKVMSWIQVLKEFKIGHIYCAYWNRYSLILTTEMEKTNYA